MGFVVVDCGGFKQIISTDKAKTLRDIREKFTEATIEGDTSGKAKVLTGEEVAKLLGGRVEADNSTDVFNQKVKTVTRGRGRK